MSTHTGEPPKKESSSWQEMRAVLSPLRDDLSCAVGVPVCKKCLGFVQRHTPEMQQRSRRFFPSVQSIAAEARPDWVGEMGDNDMEYLECQEPFLFWACSGTPKDYVWQCNGFTGGIPVPKCSATGVETDTSLCLFLQVFFFFLWDIRCCWCSPEILDEVSSIYTCTLISLMKFLSSLLKKKNL